MLKMKENLPARLDAEDGLLACLLYQPSTLARIAGTLKPEHFYRDRNAVVYQVCLALHARGAECSTVNVIDELERYGRLDEVGGAVRLFDLPESPATLKQVEYFAEQITHTYTLRKIIEICGIVANSAYNEEEDTLELAQTLIMDIALAGTAKATTPFSEAIDRYVDAFDERRTDFASGISSGTPTGLVNLDRLLGGLRKSRLYALGGRPGYGKTSLALTVALYVASHAKHALFFSLEMDEDEMVEAALSAELEIDSSFLRDGDIKDDDAKRLKWTAERMKRHNLKIADRTYLLSDICTQARATHLKQPLDLIVVDYWQLVKVSANGRGKNESRTEEVAKIGRELKQLARELKVPILALAQMNRESERKGNAVPQMSDMAESAGIEQNSDCVMFIYCPEEEQARRENNLPYNLNIIVKKHRKGRIGTAELRFRPKLTKFENPPDTERYEEEHIR